MPEWYKKYDDLLKKCKRIGRSNSIILWFEETSAKMKLNMLDLQNKKIRTRLSGKQCI